MLAKFQLLDTTCLQLGCSKGSTTAGVSVSEPQNLEQPVQKRRATIHHHQGQREFIEKTSNGAVEKLGQSHWNVGRNKKFFIPKSVTTRQRYAGGPDDLKEVGVRIRSQVEDKEGSGIKVNSVVGCDRGSEKTHNKCSTKWLKYGGCLPAILEALETVSNLDEALKPWEKSLNNKERSIILKEQSRWERALEIFGWFKRKGCYELNIIHYNIMLRILGRARRWVEVEALWVEMRERKIAPVNSTYGTLIDAYSKAGLVDEASKWLHLMNEQGMEPDEVTMCIIVQMYKKAREYRKAEEVFRKWSSGGYRVREAGNGALTGTFPNEDSHCHVSLSSYTYNTLIDVYGKAGQLKEASETFGRMLREGIMPSTVTFNTMIHIYGNHGQIEEVASILKKMEELRCKPDTRTYNVLIALYTKHDNIEAAANYFKRMKEASLQPDLVSYRTLLYAFSIRNMIGDAEDLISEMDQRGLEIDEFTHSALTRMYIAAGMLEKSWLWFKRFHFEGKMTSECYSANMDAYGERGHVVEAEEVFICCQEKKKLTVLEFNVMIKAYGISKRYDKACRLFDSMDEHGIIPDECSYNSLVQILSSADLPHMAKSYVRKMREAGLVRDCIPYCAVISSFIKLGQLENAVELYEEMIGFNMIPDVVVYGIFINAFADVGNVEEAMTFVEAMNHTGIPMNAVLCNSLIKLYTKVGYLKEAQETYNMLQSFQACPDVYTSNCMIDLYSKHSKVRQAEEIFENLKRLGSANEFSYAMMLCMYKRNGMLVNAFQIAQKMRELGLLTELLSYNHVLGLYASDGRFKEAAATFKEMIIAAVQPDDATFKTLGIVLVKCGVSKDAVGELEKQRKGDSHCGRNKWMSILSSVVGLNNDDVACDNDDAVDCGA